MLLAVVSKCEAGLSFMGNEVPH